MIKGKEYEQFKFRLAEIVRLAGVLDYAGKGF
jgi:hypothetical protein